VLLPCVKKIKSHPLSVIEWQAKMSGQEGDVDSKRLVAAGLACENEFPDFNIKLFSELSETSVAENLCSGPERWKL
jgi:hypothetical protein